MTADGAALLERFVAHLTEHHALTRSSPLHNPVSQLGLKVSQELATGTLTRDDIASVLQTIGEMSLAWRAQHLAKLVGPTTGAAGLDSIRAQIASTAREADFETFAAFWSKPVLTCVFTAHPTFMLAKSTAARLAAAASSGEAPKENEPLGSRTGITLTQEHDEAMAAVLNAQGVNDEIAACVLAEAQTRYSGSWHTLAPRPFRFGTWVGYDMDGRTDIKWWTAIAFRLQEKAARLARYIAACDAILHADPGLSKAVEEIKDQLSRAETHTRETALEFTELSNDPEAISVAANALAAMGSHRLVSLRDIVDKLTSLAGGAQGETARRLVLLIAAMKNYGLGIGTVHFRINAKQVHNAFRQRLRPGETFVPHRRGALMRIRELIAEAEPLQSNMAALAIESTTTIRQFLAIAQILKHIDADQPVRLLIVECEYPATILSAIYFAKLLGVDGMVDISPLFETERALEQGARILDDILKEPDYRTYAARRGVVAIQTVFSDAGRFVGQIPASLAIERLHGRFAEVLSKHEMTGVAALVFDTHGESMGRGAHNASLHERLTHVMSPWSRAQFVRRGIPLWHEVSFQGGDGYLLFQSPSLARATLCGILSVEIQLKTEDDHEDSLYSRTDTSLDFYRAVRNWQVRLFDNPAYGHAVTAFGLALLPPTGSRPVRRASGGDGRPDLRKIRAIPHNAVLQQLGYPANVMAGVGSAAEPDLDAFVELYKSSARMRGLIRLVRTAEPLSSIKTLLAYSEIFDANFWATRPYRSDEGGIAPACLALAERLTDDKRTHHFKNVAARLRIDWMNLKLLERTLPVEARNEKAFEGLRQVIGVLHGLRWGLMQHIFLKAAQIPQFARSRDFSREEVIDLLLRLEVNEAVAMLRDSFPRESVSLNDFKIQECSDYPDLEVSGYSEIHSELIEPLEQSHALIVVVSLCIANYFGAFG